MENHCVYETLYYFYIFHLSMLYRYIYVKFIIAYALLSLLIFDWILFMLCMMWDFNMIVYIYCY